MILHLLLTTLLVGAQTEIIDSPDSAPKSVAPAASSSKFGADLSCLNRLEHPIAKRGFIYLNPNFATFSDVPLFTPSPGPGVPEYPIAFPTDNGQSYTHYYTDPKTDEGYRAGSGHGEEFRQRMIDTPFYKLGRPEDKIEDKQAFQNFVEQSVMRLKSMPGQLQAASANDNRSRALAGRKEYRERQAQEALCACMQSTQPTVVTAAQEVAKILNFTQLLKDPKC